MNRDGRTRPTGALGTALTRDLGDLTKPPRWTLDNWLRHRWPEAPKLAAMRLLGRLLGVARLESSLTGAVYRRDPNLAPWQAERLRLLLAANTTVWDLPRHFGGRVQGYGVLSTRLVTDAGVQYLVDALQNLTEPENFKYHGYGTGTTAEGATQTALVTELTTQYATDNVRPTGSQTEASANIYRTVATLSPDTGGTIAITEHGIFSATSAGTLLDRSVFTAVNVVAAADSLQTTYDLTIASGG